MIGYKKKNPQSYRDNSLLIKVLNRKWLILFCLMFLSVESEANLKIVSTKNFNLNYNASVRKLLQESDSGYLMIGDMIPKGKDSTDMLLFRINSNGDSISMKTIGGATGEEVHDAVMDTNGNLMIIGSKSPETLFGIDMFLTKLNGKDSTEWLKTYPKNNTSSGVLIKKLKDNKYLIGGNCTLNPQQYIGFCLFCIDSIGDTVWTRAYDTKSDDYLISVVNCDSGYLALANSGVEGKKMDLWLLKLNESGDIIWTKNFGSLEPDFASSMIPTMDGNFLIIGYTYGISLSNPDMWILKIKNNGDTLWSRTYRTSSYDFGEGAIELKNGSYVTIGYSLGNGVLYELTQNGTPVCTTYVSNFHCYNGATKALDNGNLLLAGFTGEYEGNLKIIEVEVTDSNTRAIQINSPTRCLKNKSYNDDWGVINLQGRSVSDLRTNGLELIKFTGSPVKKSIYLAQRKNGSFFLR